MYKWCINDVYKFFLRAAQWAAVMANMKSRQSINNLDAASFSRLHLNGQNFQLHRGSAFQWRPFFLSFLFFFFDFFGDKTICIYMVVLWRSSRTLITFQTFPKSPSQITKKDVKQKVMFSNIKKDKFYKLFPSLIHGNFQLTPKKLENI